MKAVHAVQSFAFAAFMLGHGCKLVGAGLRDGELVYQFSENDVQLARHEYAEARRRLNAAAAAVTAVQQQADGAA